MPNKLSLIILLFFSIFNSGCEKPGKINIIRNSNVITPVTGWQIIGPFQFDTIDQDPKTTFYIDDLKSFYIDENRFSIDDTAKLSNTSFRGSAIKRNNARIKFAEYAGNKVTDKSNFYAFTNLYSPDNNEVALIVDGSYSYKLWFNQNPLVEVLGKLNTQKIGDRIIPVKLNKGDNLLFAKVNRGGNMKSWDLIVGISSLDKAREIFKKNYLHDFIQNPLVEDFFEVYSGPYLNSKALVFSNTGEIIRDTVFVNTDRCDKSFKVTGMNHFPDGFYKCSLIIDNDTLNEMFYKGDFNKFVDNLSSKLQSDGLNTKDNDDIDASVARAKYLKNYIIKNNTVSESKFYNRNRVFWAYSASEMLETIRKRGNNKNLPGTYVKTYCSGVNDSIYHFLFHVSEPVVHKGRVPLIVIAPYELSKKSMIEDWYISGLDQTEMDCKLADERGFALLWLYMKGKNYDIYSAREDINQALERIEMDYDIDTTKIFLMGNCVGGKRALLLAANNPDRYAGIAVYEPITSGKNEKGPINFVNNFYNIPVFISHGRNDLQSPIENSRNFIREASECGFHPEYTETEGGHLEFSKDSRTGAFDFFANLKGEKSIVPEIVKFSTYDLNNCSSYWIKIDKIYPDSKATIKAVWNKKNNRIDIDCENITRFTVLLKKLSFTGEGEIVIYVNGKLVSKEKPEQGILSVDL